MVKPATFDVNAVLARSSRYQAQAKEIEDALDILNNWRSETNSSQLIFAFEVIISTDTIAQEVAPQLVDFISNYSKEENPGVLLLAIKAALLSPKTEGLKEALVDAFKNYADGYCERDW